MIDNESARVDSLSKPGGAAEDKRAKTPEERAAKRAKKADEDEEKAFEKAQKLAERWEKQQDRIAKLHLDGDKMLLRWLRTSLVLITTGIGVERALKYLEESRSGVSLDPYTIFRMVGLVLVVIGLAALWIACAQHRVRLQAIRLGDPAPVPDFSLTLWVSVAVAVLSVIAFLAAVVSFGSGRLVI